MKVLEEIKEECRASWSGAIGEQRAADAESFIMERIPVYAEALGFEVEQILVAMENYRSINAVNHYQSCYIPPLDNVRVFDTLDAFHQSMPSKTFRCPACKGVSTNPNQCNADPKCGWSTTNFFGIGSGISILVKETFLETPKIHEIFMPLDFE